MPSIRSVKSRKKVFRNPSPSAAARTYLRMTYRPLGRRRVGGEPWGVQLPGRLLEHGLDPLHRLVAHGGLPDIDLEEKLTH